MSGIEVTGLVLGAFPILLNICDYYRKGCEPLEDWLRFQRTFNDLVDDVRHQRLLYMNTMSQLLQTIVVDEVERRSLLQDGSGACWHDETFQKALGQRLGDEHDRFLRLAEKINKALSKLHQLLGAHNPEWVEQEWAVQLRRLRISFSREKDRQVEKLAKYNQQLQEVVKCTNSTSTVNPYDPKTAHESITVLETSRQQACAIHNALNLHWSGKCAKHKTHEAGLQPSEAHSVGTNTKLLVTLYDGVTNVLQRDLILSPHTTDCSDLTRKPRSAHIEVHNHLTMVQEKFEKKRNKKKQPLRAMFSNRRQSQSKLNGTVISTSSSPTTDNTNSKPPQPVHLPATIADLCDVLEATHPDTHPLGLISDEFDRTFLVRSTDATYGTGPGVLTPLREAIHNIQESGLEYPRQKRFETAALLSRLLLQLQESPWLLPTWSTRDFYVVQVGDCVHNHRFCTRKQFHPHDNKVSAISKSSDHLSEDEARQSLFRLGVTILELVFGQTIEQCPLRKRFLGPDGSANTMTDFCTAWEWSKKVFCDSGAEIEGVVRSCLGGSFGAIRPNFLNADFRKAVYIQIVQPLQACLGSWKTIPPI